MCDKIKQDCDALEALWGQFNQIVLHKVAAEQAAVDDLVEQGNKLVGSYQTQVRVALALIKAAEPKKAGGRKRVVAAAVAAADGA